MNMQQRRACRHALREIFGVADYRPGQKAAASCLLSGRDLMCILPTGAGKSLCWQLPAVVHEGLTLVVSPLIALMQDQVRGLRCRGIPSVTLNSLMSAQEQREAERQIRAGEVRILFVSPERLESGGLLRLMEQMKPWLLVVDEAHCVVQWGDSFRKAYSRIGDFLRCLTFRPVICAMTATADGAMQRRIAQSLGMRKCRRVMLSVLRPNLRYTMRTTASSTREILRLAVEQPCRTVVFCRSRNRTEALAEELRRAGVNAVHYHAGMDRDFRSAVQDAFASGAIQVLTATTAFGMGVDIPDIRRVIHDALPDSITELVQRSGRAGRDGEDADVILLFSPQELAFCSSLLMARYLQTRWQPLARLRVVRSEWLPMRAMLKLLLGGGCIPQGIAATFGQRVQRCGCCSACLNHPGPVRVPPLPRMNETELLMWLLTWQRDALAHQQGVQPDAVLPRQALRQLALGKRRLPDVPDGTLRHFLPLVRAMTQEQSSPGRTEDKD
ncbi:MAG: ATP-dependent DNA helicase RecQ [Clostridia bacterium]|nr:ATP-dependent DNA helicase RecQ [Clostridia bacterium]